MPAKPSGQLPAVALSIEEIARYPLPGSMAPGSLAFSPDGKLITYLFSPDGSLVRQLYAFDPENGQHRLLVQPPAGGAGEDTLSLAERLRRERQRQRELGVTQYAWSKTGSLLLPFPDGLYIQDGTDAPLRKLVASDAAPILDAHFSPDGAWVSYVQDAELYVIPAAGGETRQLTFGAREQGLTHGLAEYIAQEEMGRSRGYWWSPDSRQIAFTEVDERHIPVYRIVHQGSAVSGAQEDHRYPFAGEANACVRLGVVPIQGGNPLWLDLGEFEYLARVNWLSGSALAVQLENRPQTSLDLVRFDLPGAERRTLLREENPIWINLNDNFRPLKSGGFLWTSERTGFSHLYLYDGQGSLVRPLTQGDWLVEAIAGVDEDQGKVYFTASQHNPLECHLYATTFAGDEPQRLTSTPGMHTIVCNPACNRFVDTAQSLRQPPQVTLHNLSDGALLTGIYTEIDPRIAGVNLEPPELISLTNRGGTVLYGALYRPPASFGVGPHPAIVMVYGGPHKQLVQNSWALTVSMRAQYLRSRGFLVFALDNRGSARRGLAFEGALRQRMGISEVEDQVDGVRWLVQQGLADPARVGIFGWSYGGFMAAMCLAQAADVFKVAVAGAPVTAWDGYDTHYTERYMGTPRSNPQGYAAGSVMTHVEKLRGKLLLVHGLIDENVHFRHSARLINALIQARKSYDLLLFPDERHMPRKLADRVYMEQIVCGYFEKNL